MRAEARGGWRRRRCRARVPKAPPAARRGASCGADGAPAGGRPAPQARLAPGPCRCSLRPKLRPRFISFCDMSRNLAPQLDHLGDFTATRRVLTIAALAVPIGAFGALTAWALLRLIGLITNLVFYGRFGTDLLAPGGVHHPPELILLAPVAG